MQEETLSQALAQLAERKIVQPEDFREGASEAEIGRANTSLPYLIPPAWQEVLQFSNGFYLGLQFFNVTEITPPDKDQMKHLQEAAPVGSLIVAIDGSGDAIYLDAACQTADGDCPVVWTNHEGEPETWRSIPAMLFRLIETE